MSVLRREAALWFGAACAGLAGGLGYKEWATRRYGGEASELLAAARAHRASGDAAGAAAKLAACHALVAEKGGAHQRTNAHSAALARAAADAYEDAAAVTTDAARAAAHAAAAEAHWRASLDVAPPRHPLRAVALDRLAGYAQGRGETRAALELYARAVRALASPQEISTAADTLRDRGTAGELAGVMHNFATCLYEDGGGDPTAAIRVCDQAVTVCDLLADADARTKCAARVRDLRAHLSSSSPPGVS